MGVDAADGDWCCLEVLHCGGGRESVGEENMSDVEVLASSSDVMRDEEKLRVGRESSSIYGKGTCLYLWEGNLAFHIERGSIFLYGTGMSTQPQDIIYSTFDR